MFGKKTRGFRKREIKIINKPVYENPYFKRRKPGIILRLIRKPKRIILVLILIGLTYFFFYSKLFKIDIVDIQGTQELTYDRVRYEINKAFVVRRFIIFRQSNIFIYDKKVAEKTLGDTLALDEIKIKKRIPNKIIVVLKEKIPNLTFITQEKYYYLDLSGIVTHEVPKEEVKEHFPVVEDLNDREVELNDRIFSEKIVNAIFELKENFSQKTNTNIETFLIPEINCPSKIEETEEGENVELENTNTNLNSNINVNINTKTSTIEECDLAPLTHDITVKTEEGLEVFFTTTEAIATQLERLKVYLLQKALDKESLKNFVYIDLRFGEKIYVK